MKIYIGSDHGGFELKSKLKVWLENLGHQVEDLGADSLVQDDDYPDFALKVAQAVSDGDSLGILICRSGGGMVIAANKVAGIRAVDIYDQKSAVHAKQDNNANVVTISADWNDEESVKKMLTSFLEAVFTAEERHLRRINKILEYEKRNAKDV
jgi:ribose 5-phosphate isomerase B